MNLADDNYITIMSPRPTARRGVVSRVVSRVPGGPPQLLSGSSSFRAERDLGAAGGLGETKAASAPPRGGDRRDGGPRLSARRARDLDARTTTETRLALCDFFV